MWGHRAGAWTADNNATATAGSTEGTPTRSRLRHRIRGSGPLRGQWPALLPESRAASRPAGGPQPAPRPATQQQGQHRRQHRGQRSVGCNSPHPRESVSNGHPSGACVRDTPRRAVATATATAPQAAPPTATAPQAAPPTATAPWGHPQQRRHRASGETIRCGSPRLCASLNPGISVRE